MRMSVFVRQTGLSISGMRYRGLPMGPAPNRFQCLYDVMVSRNLEEIIAIPFGEGYSGEGFVASCVAEFDETLFTNAELRWLEKTAADFATTTTHEITKLSHQQSEWIKCHEKGLIMNYF